MIQLNLTEQQAIRLYKELRHYNICGSVVEELQNKLTVEEQLLMIRNHGFIECKHCEEKFKGRIPFIHHIRVVFNVGLAEAITIAANMYPPTAILGVE